MQISVWYLNFVSNTMFKLYAGCLWILEYALFPNCKELRV